MWREEEMGLGAGLGTLDITHRRAGCLDMAQASAGLLLEAAFPSQVQIQGGAQVAGRQQGAHGQSAEIRGCCASWAAPLHSTQQGGLSEKGHGRCHYPQLWYQ